MIEAFVAVEDGRTIEDRNGDLVVPWWSFTKTMLAAAVLTLVRDGRLDLDTLLPDRAFTLRQLLQHRAGLTDYGHLAEYHEAVARQDEPWSEALLMEKTDAGRLRYAPGQGWEYSNIGYLLLRRILEDAEGDGLDSILQSRVLRPLGIADVRVAGGPQDLALQTGVAAGYHPGWVYHGLLIGPLRSAALALHRLTSGDLLPPDLTREMADGLPLQVPVGDRPWRQPGYGLGMMSGTASDGGRACGHTGGGPGSVVAVYHRPESGPPRTAAAFVPGTDAAEVEAAAFGYT